MTDKTKKIYLIIICVLIALILATVIVWLSVSGGGKADETPAPPVESYDRETLISERTGITVKNSDFDTSVVEESLREMGFLVTEEYLFTEVASYDSTKSIFGIDIPFTESAYLESYDGHVSAGIEFADITVICNEETKEITVLLPKAVIKDVVIDPDSFTLYSEKNGLGNRISVSDFNVSLAELKQNAEKKAIDRNILELARENAKALVSNLVKSLDITDGYRIVFN